MPVAVGDGFIHSRAFASFALTGALKSTINRPKPCDDTSLKAVRYVHAANLAHAQNTSVN